jgi:superfamily I DNA/RNA helicase
MREAISEAGLEFPGYEDVSKVRTAALEAQRQGAGPRFDGVLLDEAQDFDTEALRFAVGLLRPGRDELVVAADASQNIFRARGSWRQAGIQAQGRTLVLRVNYRNTRQILEFAQRFLTSGADAAARSGGGLDGDDAPIEPESALRAGPLPEVRQVPTAKAEAEAVAELVQAWLPSHTGPRCLGILYGSTLDSGVDRPRLIEARLRELGLPCFWANDPEDRGAKDRYCRVSSPVVLCTIQSAKWLEFPAVILCGPFRENLPAVENRRLAYVGMTRATERLAVVVRQSHPLARHILDGRTTIQVKRFAVNPEPDETG